MPDLTLDLRYLRCAIVVAEHGSFRRAADALSLSQSTLSRRVQLLERRLGVDLFERSRAGAQPTEAGSRFMRDAAISAEHLRRSVAELGAARRGDTGKLRLGLVASLSQGPIADLLEGFRRLFPRITLTIEEATSASNAAAVSSGRLDAAFIVGKTRLAGCVVSHFCDEGFFVAVSSRHRLAARSQINWRELDNETFLVNLGGHGPEVEGVIIRMFARMGSQPKISGHRVGYENLLNLVGKGYGITLVTASSLGTKYAGVRFLPVAPRSEICSWHSIRRENNSNPALMRLFEISSLTS